MVGDPVNGEDLAAPTVSEGTTQGAIPPIVPAPASGQDLAPSTVSEGTTQGAVPLVVPAPAAGQGVTAPPPEVADITGVVVVVPAQTKGETVSLKDKPFAVSPARVVFPERHKLVTPLGPREPFFLILHHRRKDEEDPILEE